MGWTSFNMRDPVKDWFAHHLGDKFEVLDSALVQRNTLYAAVKIKETGDVMCTIYLVRWSKGYYNFAYKDMDETAGPYKHDCPLRIMKLLTPIEKLHMEYTGYAKDWRERVYEYWDNKKKIDSGKYLIETDDEVKFTNGYSCKFFRKEGKKFIAGVFNGEIFLDAFHVRFNPLNYNYKLICLE